MHLTWPHSRIGSATSYCIADGLRSIVGTPDNPRRSEIAVNLSNDAADGRLHAMAQNTRSFDARNGAALSCSPIRGCGTCALNSWHRLVAAPHRKSVVDTATTPRCTMGLALGSLRAICQIVWCGARACALLVTQPLRSVLQRRIRPGRCRCQPVAAPLCVGRDRRHCQSLPPVVCSVRSVAVTVQLRKKMRTSAQPAPDLE